MDDQEPTPETIEEWIEEVEEETSEEEMLEDLEGQYNNSEPGSSGDTVEDLDQLDE